MKRFLIILFLISNLSFCFADGANKPKKVASDSVKEIVDEIKVRVNGVNITKSFLEKPQAIMGGMRLNIEEAINNELLFQRAKDKQLLPTSTEVDKQITSLKIQNGIAHLTDEELEEELKEEGLSLAEYKSQMARFIAIERLKAAEFSERIVVTQQEIEDYYKKNPDWSEEKYQLKICELKIDDVDENGKLIKRNDLIWDDLGWIKKKDLSSSLTFVSGMKKGQTSSPIKIGDSYQLVRVIDRLDSVLRTLDERYNEIEQILMKEKKTKFVQNFEKELRSNASIVYLT